jgi:hypothetical protein
MPYICVDMPNLSSIRQSASCLFKAYPWIWLGIFALLLRIPLSAFPEFTQQYFQNGLFAAYRVVWDHTFALSPVPLVVLLLVAVLFLLFRFFRTWANDRKWLQLLKSAGSAAGFLVFWFYLLWGYNYHAPTMRTRLAIPEETVGISKLVGFLNHTIEEASTLRLEIGDESWKDKFLPEDPLDYLRLELESVLGELSYPTSGKVRCRKLNANGFMRRMGILGIYLPFVGEGHVDASQTSLTLYFSATHEMSHGYGITDEGEANFAAWLAMNRSKEPVFKYMAQLELIRYILHDVYRFDPLQYEDIRSRMPRFIQEDLLLIRNNSLEYPGFFPGFSEAMNNIYLQSQGVEAGVDSYGEFVNLAYAYSTMNLR